MNRYQHVRSLDDLSYVSRQSKHILTLFSGGVDSSYLLYKLSQTGCKVTALTVDLGDGVHAGDLRDIAGFFNVDLQIIDAREAFAHEFIIPAIRANAQYLGIYPISSSLSRPLIARLAVEQAEILGCDAILHTANQSQNSLRRLNGALHQLNFTGFTGSPYEYSALSREEKIQALAQAGLPCFQARGISGDANIWVREYESGALDNPEDFIMPEALFKWTSCQHPQPDEHLAISVENGLPVAVNGEALPLLTLIEQLNRVIGRHGIGRFSGLEHLEGGEKVLEVREAPAAMLLMAAFRHLETATLDAGLLRQKLALEQIWVNEAIEGRWYSLLAASIAAFIRTSAETVSGTVTFNLRRGAADLVSIKARDPLYLTDRDGWEKQIARVRGSRNLADLSPSFTPDCSLIA
ncbi:argininosuccinate synthase [Chimaeribacter coloradensis]|uniref:argininosuccinate synthase n=1 Tax=Chimaeribacter coloradensis TaxID=2060068 RepID=A0A2N5E456_9GAMM|nr:argininosuccinate synthase-related protein [Chimaeribacter coloradensis]PLR35623.1 argininosuccinate synthase [Chimaeribacter coloradensis]